MSHLRSSPPSEQAAVSSGGGCLSGFLLPPVMVLVLGCLLAWVALRQPVSSAAAAVLPTNSAPVDTPLQVSSGLSPVFTMEVQHWAGKIQTWAAAASLDPNLAATVMQIESCGDPQARSRSGATSLFQVMPFHFLNSENPYDPDTNALRGMDYLRRSLEAAGGNPRLAFAGYNGGIGVIGRGEFTWAAETIRYAYWGSGIYAEASSGAAVSIRLQEWLSAGGASLCKQAHTRLGLP